MTTLWKISLPSKNFGRDVPLSEPAKVHRPDPSSPAQQGEPLLKSMRLIPRISLWSQKPDADD